MRLLLVLSAIGLMCAGLTAHDDKKDDKKYESKAGRYQVAFPGTPAISQQKLDDGELNSASVALKGGGFMVIYTDLGAEKLKKKPKDLFDASEKNLVDKFKAKIATSKDVEFGKEKYPARQLAGEVAVPEQAAAIELRMTLVLAGNRLYQVMAFGPKELTTGAEAKEFFESFEIVK